MAGSATRFVLDTRKSSTDSAVTSTIETRDRIARNVSDTLPTLENSIVRVIDRTSWRASKFQVSDDMLRTERQSSRVHSSSRKSSDHDSRSTESPTPKSSTEDTDSDDDLLYNNPLLKKLRNPSVVAVRLSADANTSDAPSLNSVPDPFFRDETLADASSDGLVSQTEERRGQITGALKEFSAEYRRFEHRFHWTENVENGSPWVRHRAKEIFDRVQMDGLFGTSERETSVNGPRADRDFRDDDAYEIATKLCDDDDNNDNNDNDDDDNDENEDKSDNPSPSDERFKWTKLFERLVDSGQFC